MSDAVLQATIKAYDEFTAQFKKFQEELKNTQQEQKKTSQETDKTNQSVSNFFQTLGQLGALYAFQRGLREIITAGRNFELAIRQAQAVTGDMTSTLRDFAMQSRDSVYGPQQMADAFYSLGSAGLSAIETIQTAPDILNFATAGLIDMESAAYATIATIKAFRMEWDQATEVTDAFTQAMNSTTLNAPDFQWVMASSGAVAKMAAQDFREILAAAAAMKDAGVQAQDAGTSIKAALMHLMDPVPEAKKVMKELGIEIYDSAGQMKQWHDIVAEFEVALGPYNEQSKNMILSTILGTDGIRAMATGLNMGSQKLTEYVDEMKAADGTTKDMADIMLNTFDGSLRKVNASLEKSKILMAEDMTPAAITLLQTINTLIIGFNGLDEKMRIMIEIFMGSSGLVVAIVTVSSVLKKMGITMAMVTGPVGLTIMAISALTTVLLAYNGMQEQYNSKISESIKENISQAKSIESLLTKYEELASKAKLTESEQDQLKKTIENLTDSVPSAITGFDAMGNAITNIGTASEEARKKMAELRAEAVRNAEINAQIARASIPELERKKTEAESQRDRLQSYMSTGNYTGAMLDAKDGLRGWRQLSLIWKSDSEAAVEVASLAKKAREDYEAANKELTEAQAAIKIAESLAAGEDPFAEITAEEDDKKGGGTKTFKLPESKTSLDSSFQAFKKWIEYKKSLNQLSIAEEIQLWEEATRKYKEGTQERMEADIALFNARKSLLDEQASQLSDITSLLSQFYAWEEKETLRHYQALYEAQEESLQNRIDALEEASEYEISLTAQIEAAEEELANKRKQWNEEDKKRKIEELRSEVESSRQVVVINGVRTVTYDQDKQRDLEEAELEYAQWVEEQKLEASIDRMKEQLDAAEEARQEERERLQKELQDMKDSHNDKIEAIQTYYDSVTQNTILEQEARRKLLQKGYDSEKTELEQHLADMEALYAKRATTQLSSLGLSGITTGGGGGTSLNEHAQYIEDTYPGGLDAYIDSLNDRADAGGYGADGVTPIADAVAAEKDRLGILDVGGDILSTGLAMVHEGENVLTKSLSEKLIPLLQRLPEPGQFNYTVQVDAARTSKVDNMDVSAQSLVIKANELHIHYSGTAPASPGVDSFAQYAFTR